MPSGIRPNSKALKIVNRILNTPKDQRQKEDKKPSDKRVNEWWVDSLMSQ